MARIPQEDLFEGTKMTFGDHIEELRKSLFHAILGLSLGIAVGFYYAATVVQWIQTPLKAALDDYYLDKAVADLTKEYGGTIPYEMITIVREEHLGPFVMKVNPESLMASLQAAENGEVPAAFLPHRFTPADIPAENLPAFLEAWKESGPDTAGGEMWSLLSESSRRKLAELAKSKNPTRADVQAVAGILNTLVENPKLPQPPSMDDLAGSDKYMVDALAGLRSQRDSDEGLSRDDALRMNRLLISAAFPDYLNKPRVRLVELPFWKPIDIKVQSLGAEEAFMIWMKAALITGLVVSAPWVFWKIWEFVAAGLYPHEKHYVFLYLPFSLTLFFAGAALAFFFVFQPVLAFLFSFNQRMNIDPDPRISEWLSFVLFLPLGFGISFQLPLVMLFLQRIGIFSVEIYAAKWRIAILAIFVISMVLTPADPISMLLMACPLSVLYFGGLAMCRWMPKGRNPYSELQTYEP